MALPKKGIRYLDVEGVIYYYEKPRIEWQGLQIHVAVGLKDEPGNRFTLSFPYDGPGEPQITPRLIREGIEEVLKGRKDGSE